MRLEPLNGLVKLDLFLADWATENLDQLGIAVDELSIVSVL